MINGTMERRLMDRTGLVSVWTLRVWTVEEEYNPKGPGGSSGGSNGFNFKTVGILVTIWV